MSRVNAAGAASFMFWVYLPFSSLFWFRRWLSRARLDFSHKEIALQYYSNSSNTKCLQNSPGNASLCLIGRRHERVDKYFNEVRKLEKCFKAENTGFVFGRIPHLQMNNNRVCRFARFQRNLAKMVIRY